MSRENLDLRRIRADKIRVKNYELLVQECDSAIREGRAHEVSHRLGRINASRVAREWRLPLARICRRAGLYSTGLNLLARLVLPGGKAKAAATDAEIAEYAVLLLRSGAVPESVQRLSRVDTKLAPEALLFKAFGHFAQWEYHAAVPILEEYLKNPLSHYASGVGMMNLAFALVEIREHAAAHRILDENIALAGSQGLRQIQSNCHTLRAQAFLQDGLFKKARAELDQAHGLISLSQTNDHMFLSKWNLVLEGLETKRIEPFEKLRELAAENRDWESVREADLYRLKIEYDRVRFLHLYFGSPYAEFRELIRREFNDEPSQPVYVLGAKEAPRFDLRTGEIDGAIALNQGRKCHQMLEVLLRDFYLPLRIGGLFSALFPDEYFDVSTSPDRVRQLTRRTRRLLAESRIPVRILESKGFYSLRIDGPFSFRVPLERPRLDSASIQLQKMKSIFGEGKTFLAKDVRTELQLSRGSAHQLLQRALENGTVQRTGDNRMTAYQIVPLVPKKNAA